MTWAEFKAAVESAGVTDGEEIRYIDVEPMAEMGVRVQRYDVRGVASFRVENRYVSDDEREKNDED